jgi:cytochrome P450 family 9
VKSFGINIKHIDLLETLRKWPPVVFLDRVCTKPYEMTNTDGTKVKLAVGDGVVFPVGPIHHHPGYWPNPDKFDPERFSDANKDKIVPFTFMSFGLGPRNCIGSRFALMEAKAIFYYILLNFRIEKSSKMAYPIQLKSSAIAWTGVDGVWVKFTKRV